MRIVWLGTMWGISPPLSNVFLHEGLDCWFEREAKPRRCGRAEEIRFADDFVLVSEKCEDAELRLEKVKARLENHGLALHPDKTRIVDYRRPWKSGKPQAFDFVGFTHYRGRRDAEAGR